MSKFKKEKWNKLKFRKQIAYAYGISMLCILVTLFIFYYFFIKEYTNNELMSRLNSEWEKIESELNKAVEKTGEYSKIIGSSDEVINFLQYPQNENNIEDLKNSMISIIMFNSDIDSVYVYDLKGNYYAKGKGVLEKPIFKSPTEASWYNAVKARQGDYGTYFEGGGFFEENDEGFLSVITLVKEPETSRPIGVVICNIKLSGVLNPIKSYLVLCRITDGMGKIFYTSASEYNLNGKKQYNRVYGVGAITVRIAMDKSVVTERYYYFYTLIVIILFIYTTIIIFFMRVLNNSIVKPLNHVLKVMECERLQTIEIIETNKDMTSLQIGYNQMTEKINFLLTQIKDSQRQKRQYELKVLNAQVRPHFLYNTFDSVCALALMGKSQDVYHLMQALGKYYRISLHKGDETIKLSEEIDIIRNYVIIQKYRFGDIFEVIYDIPSELLEYRVLKLILQPFVENSIYHGLKRKGSGKIIISARKENAYLILEIMDTGMGIPEEKICKILSGEVYGEEKSFGIYGTVERLNLHYEEDNLVQVISEIDKYTLITIRIPFGEEIR